MSMTTEFRLTQVADLHLGAGQAHHLDNWIKVSHWIARERPDLVVADVSFISLTKVLPAVLDCCAERFDALAMIKPQFEVGRERIGSGGVVREAADRR